MARPRIEPRTSCSASQDLNHSTTAVELFHQALRNSLKCWSHRINSIGLIVVLSLIQRNHPPGLLRWSCLQTKEGQRRYEFHLVGLENSETPSTSSYDPVIIERTICLVLGPFTGLYRSFLKRCTLTNKAVWTTWRALSKPPQRRQGPDPCPLWLTTLMDVPIYFWYTIILLRGSSNK